MSNLNPKIDARTISFETYVKFSLLGKIDDLETTLASLKKPNEARKERLAAEINLLRNEYDEFVGLAAGLRHVPAHLLGLMFPKRGVDDVVHIRLSPTNGKQVIELFDLLPAHPLAHNEGERAVYPWSAQSGAFKIFPYTLLVRVKPNRGCRVDWIFESHLGQFLKIRMILPKTMARDAVSKELGCVNNCMFLVGIAPYVYTKTNESGVTVGLHFPKAYIPIGNGGFRPLTWRDIPHFRDAELNYPTTETETRADANNE